MNLLNLQQATEQLNQHQLIIYPTDTVYGIGCRADSDTAIKRLIKIKPRKSGFIILFSQWDNCLSWIKEDINLNQLKQSRPTTWVFSASEIVPSALCNNQQEIAIRVTEHPPTKNLIDKIRCPIVSTSANLPGEATPENPAGLLHLQLPIMEGAIGKHPPSRIIHYHSGKIIRD
jgi:L-threonylcarbamoyladenylate synthase